MAENAGVVRHEFPYLDGVRGLAALWVVLFHTYLFSGMTDEIENTYPAIAAVMGWGYLGVPVFIVLSGYVLMLPTLSSPDYRLPRGTLTFFKRRARRILPPYYAALAISLALIAFIPVMQQPSGTKWDTKVPVSKADVASHLLMVHDASKHWIGSINGPLWSVAVEWHIYFLMPFLLLPLWRRVKPVWIVSALVVVTSIPMFIGNIGYLHPWLLALFAAGMWAAQLTLAPASSPWPVRVFAFFTVATVGLAVTGQSPGSTELSAGLAIAAGLVIVGRRHINGTPMRSVGFLQSRPLKKLGLFSYSIYLLHSPLLGLANLLLLPLELPLLTQWLVMTFIVVPVDIAICYGFFLLVESRFLNARQRHAERELASPTTEAQPASQ